MKKLMGVFVLLGVFALVGAVSATTTETLQPTTDSVLRVSSLHVGEEGTGGVTYFNGSIVNIGENIPVTIADDLRVDGAITRGDGEDTMPVKIADDLLIQGNLTVEGTINGVDVSAIPTTYLENSGGTIDGDLTINGQLDVGFSKISSHWLNSDGVQANYVLRLPHDTQAPTDDCEAGDLYGDVSAGAEGLYLCNENNVWAAL